MKKKILIIGGCIFLTLVFMFLFILWSLGPVSNYKEEKTVVIEEGSISQIANTLKANHLIRSTFMFKVYVKLSGKTNLKASTYDLSENMSVKKIVDILEKGNSYNPKEVKITFKEGINMRKIASLISENTVNSEEDVFNLLNDEEYLDYLIEKYWFLTSKIKDNDIYYPLEGYLYPNTYLFLNSSVSVKDIIETMLDEEEKQLNPYKDRLLNNDLSIHEIITLASLVELEGAKNEDRKDIAGVIYNRMRDGWSLGMDTTTYYAFKIDDWDGLDSSKLNDCSSKYNTRCTNYIGLPVGPIANPSLESIKASLDPSQHNYYYFVSSCDGDIFLSKTSNEQQNVINRLKNEGNWCP